MPKTVGVAVSNATFHFDKLYTDAIMPDQQDKFTLKLVNDRVDTCADALYEAICRRIESAE